MNDKKLWKVFSEFIRLRDSDENGICKCCTCGAVRYWKNMDCGHGVGRQHMGTKYSEQNNHAQCKKCNGFEAGRADKYKEFVDKKYGKGTWNQMLVFSRMPTKYGQFEIDLMTKAYSQKVSEMKSSKNLREAA